MIGYELDRPPSRGALQRLADLLFGTEHDVRVRVQRQFPATVTYIASAGLLLFLVHSGLVPHAMGLFAFWFVVIGQSIFYACLRSGWSRCFKDPGLMLAQNGFGLIAIALSYGLLGPICTSALALVTMILIYGMFSLRPAQTLGLGAFTVVLFGATMAAMVRIDPVGHPADIELMRFVLVLTTLPAVSLCTYFIARLRERLVRQKQELREALERAQELATHDMLTGLYNRQHMLTLLAQEKARQERHGGAFTVALIDLDWFKRINDTHGHAVGDQVLQSFAAAATQVLRNVDVMARWGGEEFLVLFPATPAAQAVIGLQRLREHLQKRVCAAGLPDLRVTFSAGLAEHDTDASLDATLEHADRALYRAKAQGRDQDCSRRDAGAPERVPASGRETKLDASVA